VSSKHHTRVYGSFKDFTPWLAICAREGLKPDIIYPVGSKFVVATSDSGNLYIRRSPNGSPEIALDPGFFSKRLHKDAVRALRQCMCDVNNPAVLVRWNPDSYTEKDANKVS